MKLLLAFPALPIHRIIQLHRAGRVGRDLKDHLIPIPWCEWGYLLLDQVPSWP